MKKHTLKSMTDFVLERENMVKQTYEEMSRDLYILAQYAYFLKQSLKLGMFIPCDENDNPLEEPSIDDYRDFDGGNKELFYHNLKLFKEAKKRVIFNGFELVDKKEVYDSIKGILIDLESQTFQIEGSIGVGDGYLIDETIEYLTSLELELTESAVKQFLDK